MPGGYDYATMSDEQLQKHRARNRRDSRDRWRRDPDAVRRRLKVIRARKTVLIHSHKDVPCKRCGVRYPPYVMDLHHRNRADKVASVSKVVTWSDERLLAEIAKCDVLCANCHRYVEYEVRTGGDSTVDLVPVAA